MKNDKCTDCQGRGWHEDHNPNDPVIDGEHVCETCPIQIQCMHCLGTGKEL